MRIDVSGHSVNIYTGARPFDPDLPVAVLIHGAGHDHSVWNHQARSLAHHGFAILAPDLPGHSQSHGQALGSIEALATWMSELITALGIEHAALVGHSMGSLIALQTAAQVPHRVTRLILIGSVAPMPVAAPLLEAALHNRDQAHAMINQWSYASTSHLGASPSPGLVLTRLNCRLMERQAAGVLATDLAACNAYVGGLDAAAGVRCPTAMICGQRDQMTPMRANRPLREALANAAGGPRIIAIESAGHAMMAEAPDAVSESIRGLLSQPAGSD